MLANAEAEELPMTKAARLIRKKHRGQKRGPPSHGDHAQLIAVRCQRDFLERLDAWRDAQEPKPSRPQAIRHLAERGLMGAVTPA
jgi:hypothetical protein